jgi:glycosyltransferase involved in cell wall biosynthesis
MPQVTVLLPVYNGANYLAQAMQSVLAQDFSDFELHVLDDFSEDESARVAQSSGDPRVRYSRNPERYGLFKTLNRGFEEAKTSLVRIWAQDDIMLPGGLRAFVDFAQRHPSAGMVYSDF